MGNGYSILLWDGWGAGLVMINPRFFTAGFDMYGNPCNWFPCEELPTEEEARFYVTGNSALEVMTKFLLIAASYPCR